MSCQPPDLFGQLVLFGFHLFKPLQEELVLLLDTHLLAFKLFDLLTLALTRGLSGGSISEHSLDATLLLLIFRLCPFSEPTLALSWQTVKIYGTHTEVGDWSWALVVPDPKIFVSS